MTQATKGEIVGIFDSKFNQLYMSSEPMTVNVGETAKIFTHPLEDGVEISDHRIIDLITIEMMLLLDPENYRDTYAQIKDSFLGENTFVIQTKTGTYGNMAMEAMPHEESPAMFDTVSMQLKFVEARFIKTQYQAMPRGKARNRKDESTVKRGDQSGQGGSLLHRIIYGNNSK